MASQRCAAAVWPIPTKAPTVGQHTDEDLSRVPGYDEDRIAALQEAGALG